MSKCRYCDKPVDDTEKVKTAAYWNHTPDICHRACKIEGERSEAKECQTIDADCNDCKHYKRGTLAPKIANHQPQFYIGGTCLKFGTEVLAQPNKWTGKECFEHRR